MAKSILQQTPPPLTNFSPEFKLDEFNSALWRKGYDVKLEHAIRCPCHGDHPLPDCQNCFGTGYFYTDPIMTKGLITNINQINQYKVWSEALLGTIAISVMDVNKGSISYFDRITFTSEYSYYSEVAEIKRSKNDVYFCFTTYKMVDLLATYMFIGSDTKLLKNTQVHVSSLNPYCLVIEGGPETNGYLSIYYKHCPEYHVIDLTHEIRSSWKNNKETGEAEKIQLPLQAVARRSHLIAVDKPNFDGSGVIINDGVLT